MNELKKKMIPGLNSIVLSVVFAVLPLFLTAVSASGASLPDTAISLTTPPVLAQDHSLQVGVHVTDSLPVISVRCYFRFRDSSDYVYVDLAAVENDMFQGIIPPPAPEVSSIEYFFLAVNKKQQVVRTRSFSQEMHAVGEGSADPPAGEPPYVVKTELPGLAAEKERPLFNTEQVTFEKTAAAEQYGLAGGVYAADEFAGTAMTDGYYGGFLISESGLLLPVKGLVYGEAEKNVAATQPENIMDVPLQETTDPVTGDIVGPEIQGDDWTGTAYFMDGHSNIYNETDVSAVVTQENDRVTITVTFIGYNWWGISEYFWGYMDESGNMTMYDQLDPPETWTTYFGPSTETSITIADWTALPDPEENPYPDLYVVELSRDPAPPPPEPDVPSYMSAIYKLLLF